MISKENNFAFIDSQNLNLGVKSMGWDLDFKKFRIYLMEKYNIKEFENCYYINTDVILVEKHFLEQYIPAKNYVFGKHHLAHAAGCFYQSPSETDSPARRADRILSEPSWPAAARPGKPGARPG